MKTYHIIAVHRDRTGRIASARFLEYGCLCLSRAELLRCVDGRGTVRAVFLECGRWRDGGEIRCRNGMLCTKGKTELRGRELPDLPAY